MSEREYSPRESITHTEAASPSQVEKLQAAFLPIAERNPKFVLPEELPENDPKRQIIALIGHGHLDPVWLWDQSRGRARMIHTAKSALTLMDRNDDFVYTQSSPAFLRIIQEVDGGLHNAIVERAQEGRWDAVGGGDIEPDMNKPRATSIMDNFRHAQQYYKNHVGIEPPNIALAADAFGHPNLQKLLGAAGYEMYYHMRPQRGELRLPNGIYEWKNQNGDSVYAERIFEEYGSGIVTTAGHIQATAEQLKTPLDIMSAWYGVCNHGGGPTQEVINLLKMMQDDPTLPQLVFTTTKEYFDLAKVMRGRIPEYIGELQYHARGGYSLGLNSNVESRRVESERDRARRFSTMANWVTGKEYPKAAFREAERELNFNDFHDIRQSTIIAGAEQGVSDGYGHAANIFRTKTDTAMLNVTQEIYIPQEKNTEPYVAVNPHAFPTRSLISVEEYALAGDIEVKDAEGKIVPHQLIRPEGIILSGSVPRKRVAFMLDLPPGGYKSFSVRHSVENPQQFENLTATPELLENKRMRIRFDPETGAIIELVDKALDYDFIYKDKDGTIHPAFVPVLCDDEMYGMPVDSWGHKKDQWRPNMVDDPDPEAVNDYGESRKIMEAFHLENIEVLDVGPVKASVRVTSTYRDPKRDDTDGHSKLTIDYSICLGTGRVDMDMTLDWYEKHKMLKLQVPIALESRQTTAEGVFDTEVRDQTGEEWPTRDFLDVSGRRRDKHEYVGITFFNNGAGSYSMDNRNLGLTIVRSPDVATHDPATNDPNSPHEHTDQGRHRLRFAFQTHTKDLHVGKAVQQSQAFNEKPYVELQTYNPDGRLPAEASFYSCDIPNLQIYSMKLADESGSDDVVLTICETDGIQSSGVIRLFDKEIKVDLNPGELQILRVRKDGLYFQTNVPEFAS